MFYISDEGMGGAYKVTDTDDMVTESYTEAELRSFGVEILGLYDDAVFVVRTPAVITSLLKNNTISEAIKRMPYNYKFKVGYKTRPNGLGIVSHKEFIISRSSFTKYFIEDTGRGGKGMMTVDDAGARKFLIQCRQGDWIIDNTKFGYKKC